MHSTPAAARMSAATLPLRSARRPRRLAQISASAARLSRTVASDPEERPSSAQSASSLREGFARKVGHVKGVRHGAKEMQAARHQLFLLPPGTLQFGRKQLLIQYPVVGRRLLSTTPCTPHAMLCCSPSACACTTVVAAARSRNAAGLTRRVRADRPPAAAAACCPGRGPDAALPPPAAVPPAAAAPAAPAALAAAAPLGTLPLLPPLFIFLLGEVSVPSGSAGAAAAASVTLRLPGEVPAGFAAAAAGFAALRLPGEVPSGFAAAGAAAGGAPAGLLRTEGLPPVGACCFWLPSSTFCCSCRRLLEELRCDSSEPAALLAARCLAAAGWVLRAVLSVAAAFCCHAPPDAAPGPEALPGAAAAGALAGDAAPARCRPLAPPPPFEAGLAAGAVDRGFATSWPSGKKKGSLELSRKDSAAPCSCSRLSGWDGDARLLVRRLNVFIRLPRPLGRGPQRARPWN